MGKQMNGCFLDTGASLLNFLNYKIVELIRYSYFNGWRSHRWEWPSTVFEWTLHSLLQCDALIILYAWNSVSRKQQLRADFQVLFAKSPAAMEVYLIDHDFRDSVF